MLVTSCSLKSETERGPERSRLSRLRSLLLYLFYVFRALINSPVLWPAATACFALQVGPRDVESVAGKQRSCEVCTGAFCSARRVGAGIGRVGA